MTGCNTHSNVNSLESQMLTALELFHYAYRFRGKLFALAYDPDVDFEVTITDLRVLETTHINVFLILQHSSEFATEFGEWNKRGSRYEYIQTSCSDLEVNLIAARISSAILEEKVPVLALSCVHQDKGQVRCADRLSMTLASILAADKLFFVTSKSGLQVQNVFYSHPSPEDIERIFASNKRINIGKDRLRFIVDERKKIGAEVVILGCESGALFEEIFTHRGRGTLLSDRYPNEIRGGVPSDAKDIALLIRSHVAQELILPISEDDIYRNISDFFVYTINGAVVACARLTHYGDVAELAKFCTLPRYQRKGMAHELALAMIAEARRQRKKKVFALSIVPKMWEFFRGLDFVEVDRQNLPEEWKAYYDFSRESKAFMFEL